MKHTARSSNPTSDTRKPLIWLPTLGSLVVIALVTVLVVRQMVPPAVVPASAPEPAFSAARAYEHLKTIAKAPHPTGSPENANVRTYLINQLAALGLQPEVQTSLSTYHDTGKWGVAGPRGIETNPDTWSIAGATVQNVIARIPGTESTGAVVLAAHYDSVPYGPGASDDGAGVAAILETARALLASPPLKNDVILLLTDGEEIGLMGSQAFVKDHPWVKDIALVLNLEARGSSGVALMYETSLDNAWLIRQYAKAARSPVTSSLATDVWRMMPNSSDLTAFLQAGKQGMNFAYTENWTDYHTTHDSLEDLDQRSLQHHGENALALARQYGSLNLSAIESEDAIFFSVLGLGIIHYPKEWALPLMLLVSLATLIVLGLGLRSGKLRWRGLGRGLLALMATMAAASLVGFVAVQGLVLLNSGELQVGMGGTYNIDGYELGLLVLYGVITAVLYAYFKRWAQPLELASSVLVFWLVLAIGSTVVLPGGSYLFLWPLLAGVMVLGARLIAPQPPRPMIRVITLAPVMVGLILVGTAIYLVQRMFGAAILPAGGALTALLLALAFPYLDFPALPKARWWAGAAALAGVLLLAWVGATASYNPSQPRQNFMFYSLEADSGQAFWVAETQPSDTTLSPWLRPDPKAGVMKDVFPGSWEEPVMIVEAPAVQQPAPQVEVLEDDTTNGIRTLRLNLKSERGAWAIMADIAAPGAILEGELYGERFSRDTPRDHLFFKVIALPPEGVEIGIRLTAGVPVSIHLADVNPSLPLLESTLVKDETLLRTGYGGGHGVDWMTLIHRRYTLK